jgi:hypothetical protein
MVGREVMRLNYMSFLETQSCWCRRADVNNLQLETGGVENVALVL